MQLPKKRNPYGPNVLTESILDIIKNYEWYYVTSLTIDYSTDTE